MFELKTYQSDAMDALERFLKEARADSCAPAFEAALDRQGRMRESYDTHGLGEIPYVCLRLPTGGGKTLLASHSVKRIAQHYLSEDAPVVLWLVPSNAIRNQTLEALRNPAHPYREVLDQHFRGRVAVYDIGEVAQIRPHDLATKACIVVGTLATLRVEDTDGRRIYAHNEAFEAHLKQVPVKDGFERDEKGQVKYSFANVLNHHRPIVILDEAHKARTKLSFETLKRVHPACVLEFTATPKAEQGSNVLYHVSASVLKAEDMIKLPLMLTAHQDWRDAVRDALLTRKQLEDDAKGESDYIRPIVLFQAQDKDQAVTVEVLKQHLVDFEKVPEASIAIVTGGQRELDGVDLFKRGCPITCVITIEALKEGWDCSFAYVFCSVAKVRSSTDVEQLLGRVLRMPYAKRRKHESLNRAYAHVSSDEFYQAATSLRDCLIDMGFEEMEADAFLQQGQPLFDPDAFSGEKAPRPISLPLDLVLQHMPDLSALSPDEQGRIKVTPTESGVAIRVEGTTTEAMETALLTGADSKSKADVKHRIQGHRARQSAMESPAMKGVSFAPLPRLASWVQGELVLAEREAFLSAGAQDLLDQPYDLTAGNLKPLETTEQYLVDMDEQKVRITFADESQALDLDHVDLGWSENDLIFWLLHHTRSEQITAAKQLECIRRHIAHLLEEKDASIPVLVRRRHRLSRLLAERIQAFNKDVLARGFETLLFADGAEPRVDFDRAFTFQPGIYPTSNPYKGSHRFKKHYFPIIGDMKADGEEFRCALELERLADVKHWVRNLSNQPQHSFWLPTSSDRFYPDFVAELTDGRTLVVEYKGEPYKTNDDSKEKRLVGALWESLTEGNGLFLMAVEKDEQGRGVAEQLRAKVIAAP
ncbi:MAG: DEAD/DEAH box helicase family protein [Geothrix sp.]|nr:DEAD/DEAH box helicase family protein [Geothrix sp.]